MHSTNCFRFLIYSLLVLGVFMYDFDRFAWRWADLVSLSYSMCLPCWGRKHLSQNISVQLKFDLCLIYVAIIIQQVQNPKWKGITWGLLPLHSSGITACTYHLFYNQIPLLVPLQAFLTCVGNITAAYAAYRLAISNGWEPPEKLSAFLPSADASPSTDDETAAITEESASLIGFEDLGDALAGDSDYTFLLKLFGGCAVASYAFKYGELLFDFPFDENLLLGLSVVFVPSLLNAFKWYKRSQDSSFEGWF